LFDVLQDTVVAKKLQLEVIAKCAEVGRVRLLALVFAPWENRMVVPSGIIQRRLWK
jgi:hypothetical protein